MFFRQLNSEFSENFSSISLESGIHGAITIYDNKAKCLFIGKQLLFEVIKVELEVAVVNGKVDGFVGLEIADDFLLGGRIAIKHTSAE